MTHSASAGFERMGETRHRRCGGGFTSRWSPWEVGAMVAGFVVFWPLGLLALFLKWKNGEMWAGAADSKAPWSSFKAPDFSKWNKGSWNRGPAYGYSASGNAAFDEYKREQLKRLDEERRKLEEEQQAFREFVDKVRRAKDQEEFNRFMDERRNPAPGQGPEVA
jgi:hypothetical protein